LFSVSRAATGRRPPFLESNEELRLDFPIRRRMSSSRSARGLPPNPFRFSVPDFRSGSFVGRSRCRAAIRPAN